MRTMVVALVCSLALAGCTTPDGLETDSTRSQGADEAAAESGVDGSDHLVCDNAWSLTEDIGYARLGYDGEGMGDLNSRLDVHCKMEFDIYVSSYYATSVFGFEVLSGDETEVLAEAVRSPDEIGERSETLHLTLEPGNYPIRVVPYRAVEGTWKLAIENENILESRPISVCSDEDTIWKIDGATGGALIAVAQLGVVGSDESESTITFFENVTASVVLHQDNALNQYSFEIKEKDGDGRVLAEGGQGPTGFNLRHATEYMTWPAGEYSVTIKGERVAGAGWGLDIDVSSRLDC